MPFDGNGRAELFSNIKSGLFVMKDKFSEELRDLLEKMLNVDLFDRYTAQQCLKHPWIQTNLNNDRIEQDHNEIL